MKYIGTDKYLCMYILYMFISKRSLNDAKDRSNMDSVVKINLYLEDISDSAIVNDIYSRRFMVPFPARSAVAVSKLPLGALVEIEAIAALKEEQY